MLRPDPALAFGCMQFGTTADADASAALFDACLAAGIRHFDTAHVYGGGESERILGRLARGRDGLCIATKIGYSGGAGRANLLAQFDESRRRLGRDRVDLLYLHRPDPSVPLEDVVETLAGLQAGGQVRALGLSNMAAWQVMKAQAIAARLGTRIAAIQPMYSLVKRQAEVELLPMAADQGMVAFTYSPLGAGLLSGKYAAGGSGRLSEDPRYAARYAPPAMAAAAQGLAALAAELGLPPATLAVAWVMAHPARPVPLISARNCEQLAPSLAALHLAPDPGLYARIAALSPAPPPATDRLEEAP
ncbi:MAG: aldo/keto reductase [Paracoccaceae bacterium]